MATGRLWPKKEREHIVTEAAALPYAQFGNASRRSKATRGYKLCGRGACGGEACVAPIPVRAVFD